MGEVRYVFISNESTYKHHNMHKLNVGGTDGIVGRENSFTIAICINGQKSFVKMIET